MMDPENRWAQLAKQIDEPLVKEGTFAGACVVIISIIAWAVIVLAWRVL